MLSGGARPRYFEQLNTALVQLSPAIEGIGAERPLMDVAPKPVLNLLVTRKLGTN